MKILTRLLGVLAVATMVLSVFEVPAQARNSRSFCNWYAKNGTYHYRRQAQLRCGFRSGAWKSNYYVHYNWCLRVSRQAVLNGHNLRRRQLARCVQAKTDGNPVRPKVNRGFWARWDKIAGAGGSWTTGWVGQATNNRCGHFARGCRCGPNNYCGWYNNGSVTYWWPRGCGTALWRIRCTVRAR